MASVVPALVRPLFTGEAGPGTIQGSGRIELGTWEETTSSCRFWIVTVWSLPMSGSTLALLQGQQTLGKMNIKRE